MTGASFDRETLAAVEAADEVRIETRRDAASPEHGTIIWAVVVDDGVYVRSVRGERGRWYREASVNPEAALRVGDRRVSVRAVQETDAATIEKVSDAFRDKYGARWPGPTAGIVRGEVLETTLGLLPA